MAWLTAAWQRPALICNKLVAQFTSGCRAATLAAGEVHGLLYVLLLSKPNPYNKHVHDCDIFTTLYVVILVSHFSPPALPLLCSRGTLLCPNKGCKQHHQRPDWMFHSPILPTELCSTVPLASDSDLLHMFLLGQASSMVFPEGSE